jgi:molybdopterin/thiamine biosynthesis adenylyltransferase
MFRPVGISQVECNVMIAVAGGLLGAALRHCVANGVGTYAERFVKGRDVEVINK